ncbi:MAG: YitT family protein [Oscillospiraceae bacterium]|nr:YitT family protein [Oscillospiraceae bacterium]
MKKVLTYFVIAALAVVGAFNYHLFIFPNSFAPAGINGLCTMIQYLTDISIGYLSLLINIPLAIAVFFKVSRPMALRSMTYVSVFSLAILLLENVDLSGFAYATDTGTSTILGPLVAGIISGACFSILIRGGSVTGGMDFVAALIHKKKPHTNLFWVLFLLNCCVAGISYFVYDYKLEPVILCILYSFMSSMVSDQLGKNGRSAVRFEIITENPEHISNAIINRLHHSATVLPGRGIYKGQETSVLVCIVNRSQVATMASILRECPNTFAITSQVNEVMGNFQRVDTKGNVEVELLDSGTGNL